MHRLFTQHPDTVGETYLQHMGTAFGFFGTMFLASLACLIHGIFPFLFVRTGSEAITTLHDRMVTHRHRALQSQAADPLAEPAE